MNGEFSTEDKVKRAYPGSRIRLRINVPPGKEGEFQYRWSSNITDAGGKIEADGPEAVIHIPKEIELGEYTWNVEIRSGEGESERIVSTFDGSVYVEQPITSITDAANRIADRLGSPSFVTLEPSQPPEPTPVIALFVIIRNRTKAISFRNYNDFMTRIMCNKSETEKEGELKEEYKRLLEGGHYGPHAYELLKKATECFLMQECGVVYDDILRYTSADEQRQRIRWFKGKTDKEIEDEIEKKREEYLDALSDEFQGFPYFKRIRSQLRGIPLKDHRDFPRECYGILKTRISEPCLLELIWSYWHEEGMLVQTLNAISLRFQNRRASLKDPLANLDIDPLRPLNNILWGYIQDEQHRLTIVRRAYEYDHHYGITLYGKAVPKIRSVDSRSRFIEAFHNLLYLCSVYYREASDTTVRPDGFPLLNALKEVHLLLAEGAHNQYGDLPWTARVEMLMQEWIMARPEMRDFLGGRIMVPYPEPWMAQVDTMNRLQGWTDTTVRHFRDLGVFGEQILLSVRYADWSNVNNESDARLWAEYWRQEIQGYIHAYRAVTGVDLTAEPVDSTMPSVHLKRRLTAVASK